MHPPRDRPDGRFPSVDAPSRQGKTLGSCCAWSDAVICPAFDAAGRQPPACMGVRGPGPNHPQRARSTVESPGCPSPVSPTVAPYSPSARPLVLAIVVSLRRRDRSSVGAAFDQQGPDDAGHLVGQSHGDQHFRLASQHLRKPRAKRTLTEGTKRQIFTTRPSGRGRCPVKTGCSSGAACPSGLSTEKAAPEGRVMRS